MTDQLVTLRLFVRVARTRSFSRAAREMNISQPTASRMIAQLEERLGLTLFVRTTRALTLTEAGSAYLSRIQRVLDELDDAEQSVRGSGDLRGALRIGVSSTFASNVIVPRIGRFLDMHPSLQVELLVADHRQDLIEERVDLAIRFGKLADSSAIARSVGRWPLVAAAAPRYLSRYGVPARPEELTGHRIVGAGPLAASPWVFRRGDAEVSVVPPRGLTVSASDVGVVAGVAGLGIIVATAPTLADHIARGTLVRVLEEWTLGEIEVHALFPSGQQPKASARAFVEFLQRALGEV